jgi:hypothetical protein
MGGVGNHRYNEAQHRYLNCPTIVPFSVDLLALAGYGWMRRKKK